MRVVVAPDGFGGTLDAPGAAAAIAAGWGEVAPGDELDLLPLSDGGPGFVAVMQAAVGGELVPTSVRDPLQRPRNAELLICGDTAWVESAQACGLHLLDANERDVVRATTRGVGDLLSAAAGCGVRRIVVGLGGSATNDGGAGAWAGLGGQPEQLLAGGAGMLPGIEELAAPTLATTELIVATDVDSPLLGPHGASEVFAPQKGAGPAEVADLEAALRHWADLVEPLVGRPGLHDAPGAGAAGGLGFGLLALGGRREIGAALVADAAGLEQRLAGADLVVTGEGRFDSTSLRGKVPSAVARAAQRAGVPCVVVAGQVTVGEREAAANGFDATYPVTDAVGSVEAALASGKSGVRAAARIAARDWSRQPTGAG